MSHHCAAPTVQNKVTSGKAVPGGPVPLGADLGPVPGDGLLVRLCRDEQGASTAEYAITVLAAAGFAGLLVVILQSDTVRGWLTSVIERALSL